MTQKKGEFVIIDNFITIVLENILIDHFSLSRFLGEGKFAEISEWAFGTP